MSKKLLLGLGLVLCVVGLLKPNLNIFNNTKPNTNSVIVVDQPTDANLLQLAEKVIDVLKNNNASQQDCNRLSSLYSDMALLISLDGDAQLVRNTEEIRQSNRISGLMLQMNLNDKYPNLASAMNDLVVSSIGDDNIPLDNDLRKKTVDAFLALSWACSKGAK